MIDRITEQPFCQTRVSGSTFVNADCFDVFPFVEDKNVDLIISDPPYPDYYTEEFSYFDGILDIYKNYTCRQFIFWSAKVDFPLDFTARHVWDKITGAACQYDFIYERNGHKRQKVFRGHRINSTVSAQFAKEKFYGHKSQKPLNVIEDIIKYTKIDGCIFDPFMGTGSTGIAALKTNQQFIGIEKEKQYYDVAVRRLSSYCG